MRWLVLGLLAACTLKEDDVPPSSAPPSATRPAPANAGLPAPSDTRTAREERDPSARLRDTLEALRDSVEQLRRDRDALIAAKSAPRPRDSIVVTSPTPLAPPRSSAAATAPPPKATSAELIALRAALIIPIAGVRARDIPNSFGDARSGSRQHEAVDILAPRGTPVRAATAGRVLRVHKSAAGGLMIYTTDASERFILMYAHLDAYAPGLRDSLPLKQGQVIGFVGTTGNAPPNVPHVHFAIALARDVKNWWKGDPIDPLPLLQP